MLYVSDIERTFLRPENTLHDALESLERTALRVCLIIEGDRRLLGVVTDGDVRRALLAGTDINTPLRGVMNADFMSLPEGTDQHEIRRVMRARTIIQVPLVDGKGRVVALASRFMSGKSSAQDVTVVLMAGGLGTRLRPLTEDTPKPLLPLAGRPILEHIILSLKDQGFRRFFITLNYLGDKIEEYFGDGADLGVSVKYVREEQRLGTAGALSLLPPDEVSETLLVLNGDVITDMPYNDFVLSHLESDAEASMCVREQVARVEFGVVKFDENNAFMSLVEKPQVRHFINAGIYCLSKKILNLVPKNEMFDMPQLFDLLNDGGGMVRVYPFEGFWVDIGHHEDYAKTERLFQTTDSLREERLRSVIKSSR